ncbi:hypothetical protein [Photobacterium ganghwense]|uniref:hypothetical protein n=1 Tax=Photobacterium ganghwense TaxID=320778 RepID=UPI0039F05B42
MRSHTSRYQHARVALCLVMIVLFICSGQRMGLVTSCPAKQAAGHPSANLVSELSAKATISVQTAIQATSDHEPHEPCSLADHLLQLHQHQLDFAILQSFVIFLAFAILAGPSLITPVLTEPIPPTRRRHLTLCVFRE